jgi:hypothetical protein
MEKRSLELQDKCIAGSNVHITQHLNTQVGKDKEGYKAIIKISQ